MGDESDVKTEPLTVGERIALRERAQKLRDDKLRKRAERREKAEAKRPKSTFAPLPEGTTTEEVVDELSTMEGIQRRRAELYARARKGGTAIELEYLQVERHLLNEAERLVLKRKQTENITELSQQLENVQRMMSGKKGSALRRDMAPTPPPKIRPRDLS